MSARRYGLALILASIAFLGTAHAGNSLLESESLSADVYADQMWNERDGSKYQLRALVVGGRVERDSQRQIIDLLTTQNELLKAQIDEIHSLTFEVEQLGWKRKK